MSKLTVISKKAEFNGMGGMLGGMDIACAEMHISDENGEKYLTLCWVSEGPESLMLNITDCPLFDYMLGKESDDEDEEEIDIDEVDMDAFEEIRENGEDYCFETEDEYDGPYMDLVKEMAKMLAAVLKEEYMDDDYFEYEDEVWPWLTDIAGETFEFSDEE